MSEKIEGYSYQEHEPTPKKPVEIKVLNLFEVNGIQYTDNIPDNMNIGITKEQYCEYLQLQQENKQLKTLLMQDHHKIHELADVIDEVRKYIKDNLNINQLIQYELLQILDKVGVKDV